MEKTPAQIIKGLSNYQSKLDSQNWIIFAKEMRRVKGNFCQVCKMGNKITQVHHVFYDSGREPWDYKADEVAILCEDCHNRLHKQLQAFRVHVFSHLTPTTLQVLNAALTVGLTNYDPLTFVHAVAEFASTPRMVENFAKAWVKEPNDKSK